MLQRIRHDCRCFLARPGVGCGARTRRLWGKKGAGLDRQMTLGERIKQIRSERDWTLAQMSEAVGIPLSTLAKIEHDRLSMTYDKLIQLSERLGLDFAELFRSKEPPATRQTTGRRSRTAAENTVDIHSRNYDDHYLCADLRKKIMTPIIINVKSANLDEFGPLVSHEGEEFILVIEGAIVVHTEFYEATMLRKGEGHYLDSQMGHAYVRAPDCNDAVILAVCASHRYGLEQALMEQAAGFPSDHHPDEVAPEQASLSRKSRRPKIASSDV